LPALLLSIDGKQAEQSIDEQDAGDQDSSTLIANNG